MRDSMDALQDRVAGVLAGAAVGDALGGATEGWTPEQIEEGQALSAAWKPGTPLPRTSRTGGG